MTMKKFITMDLETGKKVLQTIEASFIKFSDEQHFPGATNLEQALKNEITRALAAEKVLTDDLKKEVQRAEGAEAAIRALIGTLGDNVSVKSEIDRIDRLITELTSKVEQHIADTTKHLATGEREKWNKAVTDVATKADKNETTQQLATKVSKDELFTADKIKPALLPSIAVNTVHTVTNVDAAMELVIENGDVVIINPNAKEVKTNSKPPVTGTFICVDIKQTEFDKRFRQLYSNADAISKAEVSSLIKAEENRAIGVETALQQKVDVITGEDTVNGSIKHAVKGEQTRAEAAELELSTRITASKTIIDKLAGSKTMQGSAAYLADEALTSAKAYTDSQINEVNDAANDLTERVQELETTVGDSSKGLVKNVEELQDAVSTINGNGDGSIAKALADANAYTDTKVADEAKLRKEADDALGRRIDSLEASEEFKVSLGFVGAQVGDLLAVKADGQAVKATLEDSRVVGIVVVAADAKSKTAVMGKVKGFSGLIPGKSYFLGANGKITTEIPTGVRQNIVKVGVAISATELFVNIEEPIEIRE